MGIVGGLANALDVLIAGRPPRSIGRRFGWLRDLGFEVTASGWRGMAHYATYTTRDVLVHVGYDYHYGHVAIEVASRRRLPIEPVDLERLLSARAPTVKWDPSYDVDAGVDGKLTEGARLLRAHFTDLLKGENLDFLRRLAAPSTPSGLPGRIRLLTRIAAPVERVFDLARDIDFHQRSMARTGERAIAGRKSGQIDLGETVTWSARHFGLTFKLTSRVTGFDRPRWFIDRQARGPFKSFRHERRFLPTPTGTLMIDDWDHEAPFGLIGRIADALFLERYMRRLLKRRNDALKREAEQPGQACVQI